MTEGENIRFEGSGGKVQTAGSALNSERLHDIAK